EVDRYRRAVDKTNIDNFVDYGRIKWSRDLKLDLHRGKYAAFDENSIRKALYRPFNMRFLYFDRILNEEVYALPRIFPSPKSEEENNVIVCSDIGFRAGIFSALITNAIPDLHLCAPVDAHQCFPFYTYEEDGTHRRENITDWALQRFREQYNDETIAKWDIFYYVYGLLHHPGYRAKYADCLKRELPRIPFAPDFRAFATAGQELAHWHLDYETVEPYELQWIEAKDRPLSYRVEDKMRLSRDKTALVVNPSLTLAGIPAEAFDYRLGNRSALEWVIDQYRVETDPRSGIASDPNRADDPEYIVNLVGRVIRVSLETVRLVQSLPAEFG
ncbi:MAG: DNA helicase, partial [Candidatus Sumerlaeota bacterium]|nr:DNA helicase [Candidatus Sumerlaeota bacterium]